MGSQVYNSPYYLPRLIGEIRRLRALAAQRPTGAPEWQPIETAPKDGTRVLTFGPDRIVTAYYDPGVRGHEEKWPAGWRNAFEPTHWMPLPPAPPPPKEEER